MISRRTFIAVTGGAVLASPLAVEAQSAGKPSRIGYLSLAPGPSARSEALQQGLRELGYVEGQNIVIDYRWSAGDPERIRKDAAELVRSKVDVIVSGGPQATQAAKEATTAIPIVMAFDYDPVAAGFVTSLARPGKNITGLTGLNPQLSGKRLELLKEAVPRLSSLAVLWNPVEPNGSSYLRETRNAARTLSIKVYPHELRSSRDLESAVQAAKNERANAIAVLTDHITLYHRSELAGLAAKYRLPAIYSERLFVEAGGLMSYGANDRELHRRAAVFVDKILKGASPANLPIEQPTTYELVMNIKAAKALGLTIPPALIARADQVFE
jgi:putative ABC transport system substrate-binding protein